MSAFLKIKGDLSLKFVSNKAVDIFFNVLDYNKDKNKPYFQATVNIDLQFFPYLSSFDTL